MQNGAPHRSEKRSAVRRNLWFISLFLIEPCARQRTPGDIVMVLLFFSFILKEKDIIVNKLTKLLPVFI
jgi:hypothetical protein